MKMDEIRSLIEEDKKTVNNLNELNDLKVKYLGKKGLITELNQEIRNIPNEEKKEFGQKVNELRTLFNDFYEEKKTYFEEEILNEKLKNEAIDITLPSKKVKRGSKHPMTRITEQFEDLFVSMGYTVYEGPEIESDENCFQKLNLPKGHPARDAQDTFYLKDEYENFLLRSQTSTAQVRAMEENTEKGPIRIVCPGKVYRRDEDATHSHQFMQIEGLVIDEGVSMADLKGTLETFCK